MATNERFPESDADLGGDHARDTHRGGYGDDYAREGEGGSGARGDSHGSADDKAADDDVHIGKASE
jgi:hypothetical protein